MPDVLSALEALDVTVWMPREAVPGAESSQSAIAAHIVYAGKNPQVLLWVDQWHDQAKQFVAKLLKFLGVPLNRCVIAMAGQTPTVVETLMPPSIELAIIFSAVPKILVDSLGAIRYVEVASLEAILNDTNQKQQVLNELWPCRFSTH